MTQQTNGNNTKAEYVYNSRGLLTSLVNKKSDNTVLSSFAYTGALKRWNVGTFERLNVPTFIS
ncbi:MAG: hypothetical protein RMK49_04960 [Abditibacteriales bacterium]|nr:hypothetical protein [Abditibacteriales bacterium]